DFIVARYIHNGTAQRARALGHLVPVEGIHLDAEHGDTGLLAVLVTRLLQVDTGLRGRELEVGERAVRRPLRLAVQHAVPFNCALDVAHAQQHVLQALGLHQPLVPGHQFIRMRRGNQRVRSRQVLDLDAVRILEDAGKAGAAGELAEAQATVGLAHAAEDGFAVTTVVIDGGAAVADVGATAARVTHGDVTYFAAVIERVQQYEVAVTTAELLG